MGKVGLLVGGGGEGKTMALLQLAVSVLTNKAWLGHYEVNHTCQGDVLLALAEEEEEDVTRRLWVIKEQLDLDDKTWDQVSKRLVFLPLAGAQISLATTDRQTRSTEPTDVFHELHERLSNDEKNWLLVVLDPLSRWAGAETEVDNHAATQFVSLLEKLTNVPGKPTILVSHHTTKGSRDNTDKAKEPVVRGASALADGARWVAALGPDPARPQFPRLQLLKSNYSSMTEPLLLQRLKGGFLTALKDPPPDPSKVKDKTRGRRTRQNEKAQPPQGPTQVDSKTAHPSKDSQAAPQQGAINTDKIKAFVAFGFDQRID